MTRPDREYCSRLCGVKAWKRANPEKRAKYRRSNNLKRKFGISVEEYDRRFKEQGGGCAVCGRTDKRRLAVDHDHKTERVRGLLCVRCNIALGNVQDDTEVLRLLIEYLEREP